MTRKEKMEVPTPDNPGLHPDGVMTLEQGKILVHAIYMQVFGPTSIQRWCGIIDDEVGELLEPESPENFKEEAGDVLCSLLALFHEKGWSVEQAVLNNVEKVLARMSTGTYKKEDKDAS